MSGLNSSDHGRNVLSWVFDVLNTDTASQQQVLICVALIRRDDTRAIDHVNALHQGDVLPDLGLSGNRSDNADLLLPQSVDNRRLSGIRIADHADGNLLAVAVKRRELAEKGD